MVFFWVISYRKGNKFTIDIIFLNIYNSTWAPRQQKRIRNIESRWCPIDDSRKRPFAQRSLIIKIPFILSIYGLIFLQIKKWLSLNIEIWGDQVTVRKEEQQGGLEVRGFSGKSGNVKGRNNIKPSTNNYVRCRY